MAKVRLAGWNFTTAPVIPLPFNPTASKPPAAFVEAVSVPLAGPADVGRNLKVKVQIAPAASVAQDAGEVL